MKILTDWARSRRLRREAEAREKERALCEAERDLMELKARSATAIGYLVDRSRRNHWRESIQHMIEGI